MGEKMEEGSGWSTSSVGSGEVGGLMSSVGSCTGSCWEKEEERGPETRGRRVMLVRSGETMDRTFPAVWARLVGSGGGGRLCLDDVNLPRALPRELCAGDPPVTRLGGLSGRLLGEELGRRRLARPGHTLLLASPTLRCAQTAAALAAPLGLELGLEPGLCGQLPAFLQSPGGLEELGVRLDSGYRPRLSLGEVRQRQRSGQRPSDWAAPLWERLLRLDPAKDLLVVTDARTAEAAAAELMGRPGGRDGRSLSPSLRFPPGSLCLLEQTTTTEAKDQPAFRHLPNLLPPFSFLHHSNRLNHPLFPN